MCTTSRPRWLRSVKGLWRASVAYWSSPQLNQRIKVLISDDRCSVSPLQKPYSSTNGHSNHRHISSLIHLCYGRWWGHWWTTPRERGFDWTAALEQKRLWCGTEHVGIWRHRVVETEAVRGLQKRKPTPSEPPPVKRERGSFINVELVSSHASRPPISKVKEPVPAQDLYTRYVF